MNEFEERWRRFNWLTEVVELLRDDAYQSIRTIGSHSAFGKPFISQVSSVVYQGA